MKVEQNALMEAFNSIQKMLSVFENNKEEAQIKYAEFGLVVSQALKDKKIQFRNIADERTALSSAIMYAAGAAKNFIDILQESGDPKKIYLAESIISGELLVAEAISREIGESSKFRFMIGSFQIVDELLHSRFFPIEAEAISDVLPCVLYTKSSGSFDFASAGYARYVHSEETLKNTKDDIAFIIDKALNVVDEKLASSNLVEKILSMDNGQGSLFDNDDEADDLDIGTGIKR
jgi:hypothetical protein